jgi:hypothetical protein
MLIVGLVTGSRRVGATTGGPVPVVGRRASSCSSLVDHHPDKTVVTGGTHR